MWNGIGWYGFIGPTTSTTDISLAILAELTSLRNSKDRFIVIYIETMYEEIIQIRLQKYLF